MKRIAQARYLLALFVALLGLGGTCKADSLAVYKQFNDEVYAGHGAAFIAGPSGPTLLDSDNVFEDVIPLVNRFLDVPALPDGAVVTSATFSIAPLPGSLFSGTSVVEPAFTSVESLDPPFGACTPPSCSPTIATVAVSYQLSLGDSCVGFITCFPTPTTGTFDLLSLGISPNYFADGFSIGANDQADRLSGHGAGIDSVLFPGFNSETFFAFSGVGPQLSEEVVLDYTVPEPISLVLLLPGLVGLLLMNRRPSTR